LLSNSGQPSPEGFLYINFLFPEGLSLIESLELGLKAKIIGLDLLFKPRLIECTVCVNRRLF